MSHKYNLNRVSNVINLIPLLWMVLLYSCAFYFKLMNGDLPSPSLNDPKISINIIILVLLEMLFAFSLISYAINIILLFTDFTFKKLKSRLNMIILANIILLPIQLYYDPLRLLEWIGD